MCSVLRSCTKVLSVILMKILSLAGHVIQFLWNQLQNLLSFPSQRLQLNLSYLLSSI